ncbi:MAG: hypothetical protein ABS78_14685 [Phenylobacterium sp. SCN 70-31]|nr:MAG: hypothetical protein ABS78_14685 [Phenylobacterium sp. SCN 70-31]
MLHVSLAAPPAVPDRFRSFKALMAPLVALAHDRPRTEIGYRAVAVAFDARFYRAVYTDLPAGMDALWHYRMAGEAEGRDPAPWFSTEAYRRDHPDAAEAEGGPFAHYLLEGRFQGREVAASPHAWDYLGASGWAPPAWQDVAQGDGPGRRGGVAGAGAPNLSDQRAVVGADFDAAYYLAVNPDIAASGMDPLDHFLRTGWREGRDPSPRFSVRDYLEAHPDVAASGLNPFVHYVMAGRAEGRAAKIDLGFRYEILSRARPAAGRLDDARDAAARLRPDAPERLAEGLGRLRDLHVTFSHDDYVRNSGGLQACVRRESAGFAAAGVAHLHLYPASPWPMVRTPEEPGLLGVLLDGVSLGVHPSRAVARALADAATTGGRRTFAVHSLLGHDADATADILAAAGLSAGFFWLHDFASVCAGVHLVRNDVEDCGAPPADSPACGVCDYGPFRARHETAHRRLFERLALTVVAPSRVTLDFWRARTDLPATGAVVLPHAELTPRTGAGGPRTGVLRTAFLGMPAALKGWPVFRDLAQRFADDPRYDFVHLGGRPDPAAPADFHPVVVSVEQPLAMRDAVEDLEVDIALIWPLCRETFSFTAYEAAAGGAAVLTGPDSGNVAAFAASGRGVVLPDETALAEVFASGEIIRMARGGRTGGELFDLAFSGMTADLVGKGAK